MKFLKSILKRQVNSSLVFVSFFIVIIHNSSVNFKLIHFLLWTKRCHKSPNFDTFGCSGENLPYSSCHFPNHKSFVLQIVHHLSVSWKITFECSCQISRNSCQFWKNKSVFLQILHQSSRSWYIKEPYIKYVGGGVGGFYKFFKKNFVVHETIDLNISSPSIFFRKYFMAPPINFSFLFKAYLQQYFRVVVSNIQISNQQRSWHSQ